MNTTRLRNDLHAHLRQYLREILRMNPHGYVPRDFVNSTVYRLRLDLTDALLLRVNDLIWSEIKERTRT